VFPRRNPARELVSGEGKGVGEHEEVERNLLVCSVGAGVVGGGPARKGGVGKSGSTAGQGQSV
jgi:hypothetical protein